MCPLMCPLLSVLVTVLPLQKHPNISFVLHPKVLTNLQGTYLTVGSEDILQITKAIRSVGKWLVNEKRYRLRF